jgi:WD40 repeat protein
VDLWRLADGVLATNLVGHTAQVRSVAFTRDSKFLASASFDSTVKLWDPGTGALLWSVTNDMPESNVRETEMRAVAFSPNGQLLATGDKSDRVKLWQASDGSLKAVLTGHSGSIESVALSANGQYLATGASGHDDRVKLWRISDRALVRTIPGYLGFERSVALSPDGTLLAVSSFNLTNFARSVRVWKTADGSLRHDLRVQDRVSGPGALAFSFDGTRLASANPGSTLDVWDVASGTLAFTATNAVVRGDFYSVAWSPDGNLLATASGTQPFTIDHSVALWEASGGKLLRLLIQNERPVPALAFSPDSTTLASGGTEFVAGVPVLQLWKVTDGTLIRVLRGQVSNTVGVAFSPDGQVLASANTDNTLRFWRVSDGALLHTLGEEMYNILVLGASTEFLAVGRDDATAVLLDWPVIFARTELLPDGRLALGWLGAKGPYQLQVRTNFTSDNWRNAGSRQAANSFTNPIRGSASFFRVFGRTD